MQAWIEESLKNGELFFYIVPAVLLILLLIVIFWPEKKKKTKEEIEETELDKLIKADKKLKAEIEPIVENTEEPPFKEAGAEIQLFEEKTLPFGSVFCSPFTDCKPGHGQIGFFAPGVGKTLSPVTEK